MFSKKSLGVIVVIFLIGVMTYGMIGSGAWFTDSATSNTDTFYSGTLSIDDGKVVTTPGFTITEMAPGDKTGDVVFIIENNGNIPLAWFGDLVIDGSSKLKEAIYIDYALMQYEPDAFNEIDDNFIKDGLGFGAYPGWYNTLASNSIFGKVTLDVFDDNNGMGSTPYEFLGALKPGYSYVLTLRFAFAELAGNDYQTKGPLNVSLKVDATQINEGALNALKSGFGTNLLTWLNQQIDKQP